MLLVNKENIFNELDIRDYEMIEYENYCEDIIYIESEAFKHYEMLKAHLSVDGIEIEVKDGYRSLEKQENIFLNVMNKYGYDYALANVSMPGMTDHHTGQAIDIILKKNGEWIVDREELLKENDIFNKIHSCLKYFGFIVRYPDGKGKVTGHKYKPWHIRYVGVDCAKEIGDMTLEEYLMDK